MVEFIMVDRWAVIPRIGDFVTSACKGKDKVQDKNITKRISANREARMQNSIRFRFVVFCNKFLVHYTTIKATKQCQQADNHSGLTQHAEVQFLCALARGSAHCIDQKLNFSGR
jgi:hypothetical protein